MNRVAFNIFGFNVYYYSLCILLGVIVAYILITREGKKQGLPKEFISDLIFYTLIIGILGARVYYCVFNLDYYLANPSEILKIYNGGLAIHGGVIAGLIFVYFYTKKKNVSFIKILDIVAPAVIIAQSFGRWGNFFNQEAHGPEVARSVLEGFKIIPKFVIDGMNIAGTYYQPTFYYEFLWCLLGFVILLCVRKFYEYLKVGQLTGIYLMWYGIGRFFVESLRTDSLMLKEFKVAQIVSVIMFVVGLIMLILGFKGSKFENRYDDYEIEDIKF